jgi:hypothetical protein
MNWYALVSTALFCWTYTQCHWFKVEIAACEQESKIVHLEIVIMTLPRLRVDH